MKMLKNVLCLFLSMLLLSGLLMLPAAAAKPDEERIEQAFRDYLAEKGYPVGPDYTGSLTTFMLVSRAGISSGNWEGIPRRPRSG